MLLQLFLLITASWVTASPRERSAHFLVPPFGSPFRCAVGSARTIAVICTGRADSSVSRGPPAGRCHVEHPPNLVSFTFCTSVCWALARYNNILRSLQERKIYRQQHFITPRPPIPPHAPSTYTSCNIMGSSLFSFHVAEIIHVVGCIICSGI